MTYFSIRMENLRRYDVFSLKMINVEIGLRRIKIEIHDF